MLSTMIFNFGTYQIFSYLKINNQILKTKGIKYLDIEQ